MSNLGLKLFYIIEFAGFYFIEVVLSNVRVAYDILTPRNQMTPQLVSVSVDGLTNQQVFALMNLVTMTPGTLSLDIDDEAKILQIHSMYTRDEAVERKAIEENFIRRIRRVF